MDLNKCPRIILMGKSYKDGQDEYYHRLNFHSLILFDGFCLFESEGFTREMKPGDILLVPSSNSRIYRNPSSLRCRHCHFYLDGGPDRIISVHTGEFRSLCREYDEILRFFYKNKGRAAARFWELLHRIQELSLIPDGSERSSSLHPALRQAVDYLEFHFHEKIDLDLLAGDCQISHNQLLRLFRKEFSLSITSYLIKKRMDYAMELLTQTTLPIKEIRFKCGYTDSQHFNKAVRLYWGGSPRELRNPLHQG